ncbi:MAG: hypothetical protein JO279_01930 [Verrucomicrobia bacterium]|nr:hypothetical protein [Verrucomicrobiota bacterium]MBV8375739.1 hypothetical protein [Verrucomicrobiota bacterium]
MADSQDQRSRIIAELARQRAALSNQTLLVRRNLDLKRRVAESVRGHSWSWMSLAAIFGWLLSRLPARKKKVYIHVANSEKLSPQPKPKGGIMTPIWKGMWSIAKPLVVAYLTKKIVQKAKIPGAKWL